MDTKGKIKDIYSLTPMQEGMLFHSLYDKDSLAYHEISSFRVEGEIDIDAMKRSLQKLIERYDVLRTIFIYKNLDKPRQVVLKNREADFTYHDIRSYSDSEAKEKFIHDYKLKDKADKYKLDKDVLLRMAIIRLGDKEYELFWSHHHIVMDGWCSGILINELFTIYYSLKNKREIELPEVTPYSNYITWIEAQDKEASKMFWEKYLEGYIDPAFLPKPINQIKSKEYIQKEIELKINKKNTEALNKIATNYEVTLFSCLKSMWSVLISKINNVDDCVYGTVVSGRPAEVNGIENMVGLFINTIPFRIRFGFDETFTDLLKNVQKNSISAEPHHYISLSDIQECTPYKNQLFDHILVYENYPVDPSGKISSSDLKIKSADIYEQANYDLGIIIMPGNELTIKFLYNSNIHDEDNIGNLSSLFHHVIGEVIKNPEIKLSDLQLISAEEIEFLTNEINTNHHPVPADLTLIDIFQDVVKQNPDNIAIIDSSGKYSYQHLEQKANSVANELIKLGVGAEENVGIMMEQGIDIAAGILGIMKAGAAYVPVDLLLPKDRMDYFIHNADIHIVLTNIQDAGMDDCRVVYMKDIGSNSKYINKAIPHGRAYIIYTSGTTGEPKGVEVEHGGVLNTLLCRKDEYQFDSSDICLQLFSASFDGFVTGFFTPLLSGSSVVLMNDKSRRNAEIISKHIEKYNVTHFIVVPSLLNEIILVTTEEEFRTLRCITLAGEKAGKKLIDACSRLNTKMEISQEYGVTEVSVMSTMFRNQQKESVSSIGSPVWNTQIYLLDGSKNPVPIGIEGNIHIGGTGLARGYYNNERLTKERFIDNPFREGQRIYITGDTGRWLPDGNIEFTGRNDLQVKLRGLRIEPGEIENHLLSHPDIHQTLVLKHVVNDEDILCAYYVSDKNLEQNSLREYLLQKLPAYMVPSIFYGFDRMPVTSNGKIDRRRLPVPGIPENAVIVEPRNSTEKALRNIWSEVLNVNAEGIGIDSDFFQLGGHSLRAVNLFTRIHKQFNTELPLEIIFRSPSIRLLAHEINNFQCSEFTHIPVAETKAQYALSPAQKRQYILYEMNRESTGYNMPAAFELEGAIDIERLEDTFKKIIARHDSLRTSFRLIDNNVSQVIPDDVPFKMEQLSSTHREETHQLFHDFVQPFDLSKAPLIRIALVNEGTDKYVLFMDMHHIIADGTSIMLLVKEFTQFYVGEHPEPLKLQYRDFAEWQTKLIHEGAYKKQSDYWMQLFEDEPPVIDIPTDFSRPAVKSFDGAEESFVIPQKIKNRIIEMSRENKTTPFVILLSIINVLLSRLSGQSDLVIGTSTAGRNHADLERIIGMFINTLPIRSRFTDEFSFVQLINTVKDATINAFQNQDFQFEELLEKITLIRDTSRNPLFDIMFMYQNIEGGEFDIPGVNMRPVLSKTNISKFDITFEVFETEKEYRVNVEYCTRLFTANTIKRLIHYISHIANVVCHDSGINIKDIRLESDENLLIECMHFNQTDKSIPSDKTVIDLFEDRVKEAPKNQALITSSEKLSYEELNERVDILARALAAKGVKPNTLVAVFGGRSVETVVSILAVLKSGGAYLPVDVNYPVERIKYMLDNAGIKFMVADRHTPLGEKLDCFIDVRDYMSYFHFEEEVPCRANASDLVYVIYTSGTTGNPKGVKVKHHGVMNTLLCRKTEYGLNSKDVCAQLFSPSFDGFVTSLFTPLISGATALLVNDEEIRDVQKIIRLLVDYHVSHFISVPVLFKEIVKNIDGDQIQDLKSVTLAGDKISDDMIQLSAKKLPNTEIAQEYGVTEASVMSTIFRNQHLHNKLLIGKPAWNTQIFILDKHLKLQPVGVPGEIYIGGTGVAEGYLHNEELTNEKFIANPFGSPGKIYATGDLGRWTEDGNIEFLGRNDHQVKIRGFRIELGEIESKIRELTKIEDVVVIDKEDYNGNKFLCAYFTKKQEIEPDEIRSYLIGNLPGFMVPHQILEIEEFPVTENGKINTGALRKRSDHFFESNIYVAPKTELEKYLVTIWKEILAVEKIGIKDNYFSFGGDSIKAIQIATKLKDAGYTIDITQIFQKPTIEEMAAYIESHEVDSADENYEGFIPFTPSQKDFIERETDWQKCYQSKTIHLDEHLSSREIETLLNFIYKTRDGLRLIYKEDKIFLNKYTENTFVISTDSSASENGDYISVAINHIKIHEGPLFKAVLMNNDSNSTVIFLLHELLADEWTWKIILEDFNILLHQRKNNVPFKLPPNTGSIKGYAVLAEKYYNSPDCESDAKYWQKNTFTNMEIVNRKELKKNNKTETMRIVFDNRFSKQFLSEANEAFNTTSCELFLTALMLACRKLEDRPGYCFELVNENREPVFDNYSNRRTIGRFKTHYPVLLPNISDDLSGQIKENREIIRGINKNGLSYLMTKTDESLNDLTISVKYFELPKYNFDDCLFTVENFFSSDEPGNIQVICYADPDRLEIIITYPGEIYDAKLMEILRNSLKGEMENINEYCLSRDFVIETPDDLTYKDISMDALDSLESFFESDSYENGDATNNT